MRYRSVRPSLDLDGSIVIARPFGQVGLGVGRHEGTDCSSGLAGGNPGALLRRHHARWHGVADDEGQDDAPKLVPDANTLHVLEATRSSIDGIDEQRRRLTWLSAEPQQRRGDALV